MIVEGLCITDTVVFPLIDVKLIRKRINDKGEVMEVTVCLGNRLDTLLKRDEAVQFLEEYITWWEDTQ